MKCVQLYQISSLLHRMPQSKKLIKTSNLLTNMKMHEFPPATHVTKIANMNWRLKERFRTHLIDLSQLNRHSSQGHTAQGHTAQGYTA